MNTNEPETWKAARISLFANATNTRPIGTFETVEFFSAVRDGRWRERVARIRKLATAYARAAAEFGGESDDAKAANQQLARAKKRLQGVTLVGEFSIRDRGAVPTRMSGIVSADLDDLRDVEDARNRLCQSPYLLAVWRSCSGRGLWVVALMDPIPSATNYGVAWAALARYVADLLGVAVNARGPNRKSIIDPQCKNVGRLCFVSDDESIWVNPAPRPFPFEIQCDDLKREHTNVLTQDTSGTLDTQDTADTALTTDSSNELGVDAGAILRNVRVAQAREARIESRICGLGERLEALYRRYVVRWYPAIAGKRNDTIVKASVRLIRIVGFGIARELLLAFHDVNVEIWGDSRDDHERQVRSALMGCLQSYVEALPAGDRDIYEALSTEMRRDVFRILRGLAFRRANRCFSLSQEELARRVGFCTNAARDSLAFFCDQGILRLVERGTRRVAGAPGKATRWRWTLSVESSD